MRVVLVWGGALLAVVLSAAASVAATPDSASISSVWKGEYSCQGGRQRTRLELSIEDSGNGSLKAVFAFQTYRGQIGKGALRMVGDFDARTGAIRLRPTTWIERPPGYLTVGIEAKLEAQQSRISGRILADGCSDFVLNRSSAPVVAQGDQARGPKADSRDRIPKSAVQPESAPTATGGRQDGRWLLSASAPAVEQALKDLRVQIRAQVRLEPSHFCNREPEVAYCVGTFESRWLESVYNKKQEQMQRALSLARLYDTAGDLHRLNDDAKKMQEAYDTAFQHFKRAFTATWRQEELPGQSERLWVNDNPEASYGVGRFHAMGMEPGASDKRRALENAWRHLKRSAEAGHPQAFFEFGTMCLANAAGGTCGPAEGVAWYNKAVEAGSKLAMLALADLTSRGQHPGLSKFSTKELLEKLGNVAHPWATLAQARLYISGDGGTTKDIAAAERLLQPLTKHPNHGSSEAAETELRKIRPPQLSAKCNMFVVGSSEAIGEPIDVLRSAGAFRYTNEAADIVAGVAFHHLSRCNAPSGANKLRMIEHVSKAMQVDVASFAQGGPGISMAPVGGFIQSRAAIERGFRAAEAWGCQTPSAEQVANNILDGLARMDRCESKADTVFMRTCRKNNPEAQCACVAARMARSIPDIQERPFDMSLSSLLVQRDPGAGFSIYADCK